MVGTDGSVYGTPPFRSTAPVPSHSSEGPGGGSHILVVDDDAGVRYVATAILQRAHYRVTCAEDGEEAWSTLQRKRFDLMVTDHNMPRLTGLDLLRRMRAESLAMPVVFVSADIPWQEPDLSALVPSDMTLAKPFSVAGLLTCVRRCLAQAGSIAAPPPSDRAPSAAPIVGGLSPTRHR